MCCRFTGRGAIGASWRPCSAVPESELGDYTPRFNIAPTQPYFVLKTRYESCQAMPATWGLFSRGVREAALRRAGRWVPRMARSQGQARAVMDPSLLLFAGLFEAWQPQPGECRTTFTIITMAANRTIEPIHNRMPIILDEAGADD